MALGRRLSLPIPEVVHDLRCSYKVHGTEYPLVDEKCSYLVTSCPKNGFGTNLHSMVAFNLRSMFSAYGVPNMSNQTPYLYAGEDFTAKEKRKKPGITLNFNDGSRRRVAVDVSQTCPVPTS